VLTLYLVTDVEPAFCLCFFAERRIGGIPYEFLRELFLQKRFLA